MTTMLMTRTMTNKSIAYFTRATFSLLLLMVSVSAQASEQKPSDNQDYTMKQPACCNSSNRNPREERFDRNRFLEELRAYITREARFTPQEANAFFPLFFEMKAKMHEQQRRIDRALGNAACRSASERDCQRIFNETLHMRTKQQKVENDFMKRLAKTASTQKVIKAIVADQNFGRDRFRKMMGEKKRR